MKTRQRSKTNSEITDTASAIRWLRSLLPHPSWTARAEGIYMRGHEYAFLTQRHLSSLELEKHREWHMLLQLVSTMSLHSFTSEKLVLSLLWAWRAEAPTLGHSNVFINAGSIWTCSHFQNLDLIKTVFLTPRVWNAHEAAFLTAGQYNRSHRFQRALSWI